MLGIYEAMQVALFALIWAGIGLIAMLKSKPTKKT